MNESLLRALIVALPIGITALLVNSMEAIEDQDRTAINVLQEAGFSNPTPISISRPVYRVDFGSCQLELYVSPQSRVISLKGHENVTANTLAKEAATHNLGRCLVD